MEDFPIHDLYIRQLSPLEQGETQRLVVVREGDHLLRRFGQAEILQVSPKELPELRARVMADEVWALIEGAVEFLWRDIRPESPTHRAEYRHTTDRPTVLLVPFGVAFGLRAIESPALLLRLTTHEDGPHQGEIPSPLEGEA